MSELTHHDADDGFHEIQLSGKQLVFLFMATTTLLVLTFLCGVHVGRNVKSDRAAADATEAAAVTAPPPASTPSQPAASGGPPAAEPPAPVPEQPEELSYAKRLQAESAPAEKLKPQGTQPQTAPKSGGIVAPPVKTAAAAPPPEKTAPPQPAKTAAAAVPPPPAKPEPKPAPPAASAGARPGNWIVQVISLQDRGAAGAIAKRLAGKGYPAFVLDPAPGAPRIYRVQVGGYPVKSDAEQASRRLEKDEQFKPLVRSR